MGRAFKDARGSGFVEDIQKILFMKGCQVTDAFGLSDNLNWISRGHFVEIEASPGMDGVPFELLNADGECLGLRNPVSRILNLGVLPAKQNELSLYPKVLLVTTSHPKPNLILEQEEELLQDIFENQESRVRLWNYAGAPDGGEIDQFQQMLRSADILHLAGHLEIREGEACFQLDGKEDLWLSASRFREMEMKASIVWLSTCSGTATQGVQSFAQAALCGGACVCVGSSIPVGDTLMSTACRTFYRKLYDGHCAGHAMLECRRQLARLGSPAWATTILLGNSRWVPRHA